MDSRKSAEFVVLCYFRIMYGIIAKEGTNLMLDPNYIVGFTDGEGCFSITVNNKNRNIPEIRLIFEIEVREDDEEILRQIQKVFDCGNIYKLEYKRYEKWRPHVKYKVSNIKDISDKIIPFFQIHPLQAKKKLQFEKFCKVAEMIQKKEHLIPNHIQKILEIKA